MCIQLPSYIDNSGAVSQRVGATGAGFGLKAWPKPRCFVKKIFLCLCNFELKVLLCFSLDAAGFCSHHPPLNMFVI